MKDFSTIVLSIISNQISKWQSVHSPLIISLCLALAAGALPIMERRKIVLFCTFLIAYVNCQSTDRAKADQVTNLPGIAFPTSFNQYSGYLKSSTDNGTTTADLHYWWLK